MSFERLMGIVPLGAGLAVLGFVWSQPFGGFGGIPVFIRLFFSFVALAFVLTGVGLLSGKATDPRRLASRLRQLQESLPPEAFPQGRGVASHTTGPLNFACPSCGAPLAEGADVSPHGDVKCSHCDRWFNVHKG